MSTAPSYHQIQLRDCKLSDLKRITEIYAESVLNGIASYELEPPSQEEMTGRFHAISGEGFPYLVAEAGGQIVGYAYLSHYNKRPAYRFCAEDSIYLAPEARGQGVGTLLLSALVQRAETLGFRLLVSVIGGPSDASIAVHRKAGFREIGRMTGSGYKFGKWLDTVFMELPLGDANKSDPTHDPLPKRRKISEAREGTK